SVVRTSTGTKLRARGGQSSPLPEKAMIATASTGTRVSRQTMKATAERPRWRSRRAGRAVAVAARVTGSRQNGKAGTHVRSGRIVSPGRRSARRPVVDADAVDHLGSGLAVPGDLGQRQRIRLELAEALDHLRGCEA